MAQLVEHRTSKPKVAGSGPSRARWIFLCLSGVVRHSEKHRIISYLHVKAKITNADGSNLAGTAQVGPVNLWMHALFSQVEVYLNNKLVLQALRILTEHTWRLY